MQSSGKGRSAWTRIAWLEARRVPQQGIHSRASMLVWVPFLYVLASEEGLRD